MEQNFTRTIQIGLNTLNDPKIRVPSSDIDELANFKNILRAILNRQLILVSPDIISSDKSQLSNKKSEDLEDK